MSTQQALPWSQTLCNCIQTFILLLELTFLYGVVFVQNRRAHPCRLLMYHYKGTERRSAFNSPTRREGAGLTCSLSPHTLQGTCSITPFRLCMFFHRSPAHHAFIFPCFLLVLKEAFNPASLLDHAWQKIEDLLKISDNEQKQEEQLCRKRVGLEASSFMQIHCKMFSHTWAEVACIRCPSPR